MESSLYNVNGLVFWTEREIRLREFFSKHFSEEIKETLLSINSAWRFVQIEAPMLTPREYVGAAYTNADIFMQEKLDKDDPLLVLRPETTPGSYMYARHLLDTHSGIKPPFCVWQEGKSYRREDTQPTKHMRLKEFRQQEFQCIYTIDTANDYHTAILEPVRKMIAETIGFPTRIVPSDRLPAYSEITMDVECDNGDKWMEVCSISRRKDFPGPWRHTNKKGATVETELRVLEIALGLDRMVYNFLKHSETV